MKILNILLILLIIVIIVIILIFIFILIKKLIIKKENFFITNVKGIKEARIKLDLDNKDYYYNKGSKGIDGLKGLEGDVGTKGEDGKRGDIGENGKNGLNAGTIIFQKTTGEELDRYEPEYLNLKGEHQQYDETIITVPDGIKGESGQIGQIKFVNTDNDNIVMLDNNLFNLNLPIKYFSEKEILGQHNPNKNTYADTIKPIIINVPKGLKGDKGENGICGRCKIGPTGVQGPEGDQGDKGERGEDGEKGDNGDKGDDSENNQVLFNNIKINNKICIGHISQNKCLDNELLEAIINDLEDKKSENYVSVLKRRQERLKKNICQTKDETEKRRLQIDLQNTERIMNQSEHYPFKYNC